MNEYEKKRQIEEWLQDYEAYRAGVDNLNEMVEDIAEANMGISYDKDPSGPTNKFNSVTENAAIKLDKYDIKRRVKVMATVVNSIDNALRSLTDIEREVIDNRCIKGKYYYEFCHKICVSERTAKRIKQEALRKMSIVIFGKE